jgi:serine/threonine protein kinase
MADIVNTRIDRYLLQERIGTGGMARVYKAIDTNLDRLVAIKILHEHLSDDPSFKERFEREAKLIASLNHPNIVQIYDFNWFERDGYPVYYMVMPFIPGKTLATVLDDLYTRNERMPHDNVLRLALEMADALGYAHNAGMVHRDVKPANIILNERGQAVLTDFGIARLIESSRLTQDGISTGTPAYMSPEQATGLPGDGRSDLYALGVILYELLVGEPPYEDENGMSLMLKHLNAPVPSLTDKIPQASPALDELIAKALAKNPADRFQTASEFSDALKSAFLGSLVAVLPILTTNRTTATQVVPPLNTANTTAPQIIPPLAAPPRRNWPIVGAALILAAAILTGAILILTQTQSDPGGGTPLPNTAVAPNNLYFVSSFSPDDSFRSNWPQGTLGGLTQEMLPEGFYRLRSEQTSTASTSIFNPDYVYNSVSISMTGRMDENSNPAGAYGIAFRYTDQEHYNVFAVDGRGRYSVWVRNDGVWTELRGTGENWTPDPAVRPVGEENRLLLDVFGNGVTGYVNGVRLFRVTDPTFNRGNVGIYLATDTAGVTEVLVDEYQTYPASPPSMTDGG